ncbi:probable purine permease 10 [Impatiens glandulifera]|uniref:probable purine permease 10 n=1 Tax=Impatiens glandulifera TaxID=253017 RepID=UPI001FB18055|nr:probable purine permease 10 [Impatiens glandulifera]
MDKAVDQSQITVQDDTKTSSSPFEGSINYVWWLRMAIYTILVLVGQVIAVLLGRLYFEKGGHSKWIATLVQTSGFPILIPFLFIKFQIHSTSTPLTPPPPQQTFAVKISLYVCLGILIASYCMLFSIGLAYLPVSTYSLISATQLGFNTFFSFFLNSQKITPFIVNSLILLTLSSVLLIFQPDTSASNHVSRGKYIIGFLSTVGGSAGSALWLSMMQFSCRKILKKASFNVMIEMIVYQSLIATSVVTVGVFVSGEWKLFGKEIVEFEMGKVGYVLTLVFTALCWQLFVVGSVGLIFEVSSLFSNVIGTLGLPIIPVMAVFVFHDKMDGVKVVSLVLAVWGFVSYVYQHYIDDLKMKILGKRLVNDDHRISLVERGG